jgi:hypothetical protein
MFGGIVVPSEERQEKSWSLTGAAYCSATSVPPLERQLDFPTAWGQMIVANQLIMLDLLFRQWQPAGRTRERMHDIIVARALQITEASGGRVGRRK